MIQVDYFENRKGIQNRAELIHSFPVRRSGHYKRLAEISSNLPSCAHKMSIVINFEL
jgi:hypothetical protein